MFQRLTVPPSSVSSITAVLVGLLDPTDADTTVLQNHGNYYPSTQHHIPEDFYLHLQFYHIL